MRLGTCIALELAVAASAVGGVWLVATRGAEAVHAYWQGHDADAAPLDPHDFAAAASLAPLERSRLAVARPPVDTVFGATDQELLAPLVATTLTRVKLNRGGTSLSLRLDFASGGRAAFKPLQIHPQSDPRREIAAYRIDRLLGIGHVPPARSAGFTVDELIAAVDPTGRAHAIARIEDEAIAKHGKLFGEVSWWIPDIKRVRIEGHPIDEPEGQDTWSGYLQADADRPVELRSMLAQIATVIVFDVLIDNSDRWSGNNTQGTPDNRTLYFMDNTLAFSSFTFGHATNLSKLNKIQVFPRGLIGKLRVLSAAALTAALGGEDELLGPLLTDGEIQAIIARRDHLLAYVDQLIADLGEDAVLALP